MEPENKTKQNDPKKLSLIPLRGAVIYPSLATQLYIGRRSSLLSLVYAHDQGNRVILTSQKDGETENPTFEDIYPVGTLAMIVSAKRLPDDTIKILVEGERRVHINAMRETSSGYMCDYEILPTKKMSPHLAAGMRQRLFKEVKKMFDVREKGHEINNRRRDDADIDLSECEKGREINNILRGLESLERCIDAVASFCQLSTEDKQKILTSPDLEERFNVLMNYIKSEVEIANMDKKIHRKVREQIDKNQREYYLNEQVKAIRRELGGGDEKSELEELETRLKKSKMSPDARAKADNEMRKLKVMSPMSAEATVVRSYLEWLLDLPWDVKTKSPLNILRAEKILNRHHYGLKEVKERIMEYLAVYKRAQKNRAPLILLVGPPGVGKTSLGQAMAAATGRKLVRFSLGGVHDEAEIRGHRRTYIGSMPGKIIQKLAKVKVNNPLFLLDEVDKMGMDFRGDPAAALLEALDPEQNSAFSDHYLEVDYDLSDVLFVCTANSLDIPPALLDRVEIIRLPGYTDIEKISIAQKHLIPKQLELCGLPKKQVRFARPALAKIVASYTREAGVREMERQISKIMRKVVLKLSKEETEEKILITAEDTDSYLGTEKYAYTKLPARRQIGQAAGLAWTSVGGEILNIEAAVMPGSGQIIKTGHLGKVMQESIQAAISVVRSRSRALGIDGEFNRKYDFHIHVPEGATPKDGPSAGLAISLALISCLVSEPLRADVAMTGEITLRGEVLKIGGLKEKLLAAKRSHIGKVLIPYENLGELKEIDDKILSKLAVKPIKTIDEAMELAFAKLPASIDLKKFAYMPTLKKEDLISKPLSAH